MIHVLLANQQKGPGRRHRATFFRGADVRRLCWLMHSPASRTQLYNLVEPYSRSEKLSRKRGMALARRGQNVQVFIDLEYTARRTLTATGCSKTMMMTNPKPYREWKTLHREGRLVLKNHKPEKEVGAAKPYTLKGVGRVRLCEPQQARQKGRSYKRPELGSNM